MGDVDVGGANPGYADTESSIEGPCDCEVLTEITWEEPVCTFGTVFSAGGPTIYCTDEASLGARSVTVAKTPGFDSD